MAYVHRLHYWFRPLHLSNQQLRFDEQFLFKEVKITSFHEKTQKYTPNKKGNTGMFPFLFGETKQ
jgi:hypothetical protein